MVCDCCTRLFTGFDDIPFTILADERSGVYRDWDGMEPMYAEEQIPYSGIMISELIGFTPAIVTWRLELCTTSYRALLSRLSTVGTLTILADYQSLRGVSITRGNPPRLYEQLDQVKLKGLPARGHHVGGYVEVEATFERMVDPVTRLAVIP